MSQVVPSLSSSTTISILRIEPSTSFKGHFFLTEVLYDLTEVLLKSRLKDLLVLAFTEELKHLEQIHL